MSENKVKWHPFPQEKPPLYKYCYSFRLIFLAYFLGFYWARHRDLKIVAWYMPDPNEKFHELPEPYQPEGKK